MEKLFHHIYSKTKKIIRMKRISTNLRSDPYFLLRRYSQAPISELSALGAQVNRAFTGKCRQAGHRFDADRATIMRSFECEFELKVSGQEDA
jgi:hypothetical protein